MNRIAVIVLLVVASLPGAFPGLRSGVAFAMTFEPYHTKLLPQSVDYPMISPAPYSGAVGKPRPGGTIPPYDSYRASFGTVRLFWSVLPPDYDATVKEALHFNRLYGGYESTIRWPRST